MTARLVVSPVYRIECDEPACSRYYRSDTSWGQGNWRAARREAAKLGGWQVRPNAGPGSRTAPDLCPEHRDEWGDEVTAEEGETSDGQQ